MADTLDVVFDGPPGPEAGRFVEVEIEGKSVKAGEWIQRPNGFWVLRIKLDEVSKKAGADEAFQAMHKLVKAGLFG